MKRLPATSRTPTPASSAALPSQYADGQCRAERTHYRGWSVFKLANGLVTLYVAPDIGGRVIQFQLGDHPFFFVNPGLAGRVFPPEQNGGGQGGWKNYGGSKLWPAPQGWESDDQWPGPPDPVLDGGRYLGEITANAPAQVAVTVTSPPDPRTGIQLSRTVNLFAGAAQVRHDCVMRNISRRPVRWAVWEVNQLDTADPQDPTRFNPDFWAYCPLNPHSAHPKGFWPMFGQVTHPSYRPDYQRGLLAVKYDYRVGKVGLDSTAGWLACVNGLNEHCFVGRFTPFPGARYPDDASVEFWLNGAGEFILNGLAITNPADPKETPCFIEAEILSPLVELAPGQEYRFEINWLAARCPKPVVEMTAAGPVSQPLRVTPNGAQARLEGVFGVFCPGRAAAVFKAADGRELGREDLGAVGPGQVFRLARECPLPSSTFRVTLAVADADGQLRGVLGNAAISEH